jgi:crotonobetainyl-CoA:carnitine CoA-transferase CaiB-like acyl-CoA transferase
MTHAVTALPPDQALAGVKVLSLAEQYPGPYATMLLADLGADVTLVERPRGGDPSRRFSGHFEALNRNKRSVALDLKTEGGRDAFWRLAADADVVMEGFKPGVMARLGLGADDVHRRFPRVVYVSISSFGHSGPLSTRGGHDITMQGMAGLVDTAARKPAPLPLADLSSAMFAAFATVCALLRRDRSGAGTAIDVSMLDCLVSWRSTMLVSELNGLAPAPYPPDDPGYGVFETSTGALITLSIAGEDHQWSALCHAAGLGHLARLTTVEREQRAAEVSQELCRAIRDADWSELQRALSAGGVGFGPVHNGITALDDAQVASRGMLVDTPGSPHRVLRQPVLMDGAGGAVRRGAPRLGEHTAELLRAAGYSEAELSDLESSGAIATDTKVETVCN